MSAKDYIISVDCHQLSLQVFLGKNRLPRFVPVKNNLSKNRFSGRKAWLSLQKYIRNQVRIRDYITRVRPDRSGLPRSDHGSKYHPDIADPWCFTAPQLLRTWTWWQDIDPTFRLFRSDYSDHMEVIASASPRERAPVDVIKNLGLFQITDRIKTRTWMRTTICANFWPGHSLCRLVLNKLWTLPNSNSPN